MAEMYRSQVIQLEDKLARIREEGEIGKELFKVGRIIQVNSFNSSEMDSMK